MDAAQRTRHGRLKMLGVLLVCAAPVIASYFTYYVIRPEGRKNYGELIEPQRPMPAMDATTLEGGAGALVDLKGQWLLVSVADSQCDTDCQKHLYLQRQLRESVGREKDRVDWVWLVTDDKALPQPWSLPSNRPRCGAWMKRRWRSGWRLLQVRRCGITSMWWTPWATG
jgi:hypothetical protein